MDEELEIKEIEEKQGPSDIKPGFQSDEVRLAPLNNYFGLDLGSTAKEKAQLKDIMDFLEEDTDTKVEANIFVALRNIEEKLTSPKVGETRIGKIHDYVKILRAIKSAEEERDSLLR